QRRHRGEVVRVARVAHTEDERHDDDEADCGAGRERGDLLVEAEHQVTLGSAWTVMRTPASRITAALTAGSCRRTDTPAKLRRANARLATTATRPTLVIVKASPRLNVTISSSPKATRWSEIAARSTTSADGQGRSPPETPTAKSERKPGASALAWWACSCACARAWRQRAASTEAPIETTSNPEARFNHGYR